jgi:exodeoxyribonuclease VII small subunit
MTENNDASIQDKITTLDQLVEWFDSDEFNLEMALEKFKEAELLANGIEKDLLALKNEIVLVKQKFDQAS